MESMDIEELNEHIIECDKKWCRICASLMKKVIPSQKAQEKYRQSERYKEYRRKYYQLNKEKLNEQNRLNRLKNLQKNIR